MSLCDTDLNDVYPNPNQYYYNNLLLNGCEIDSDDIYKKEIQQQDYRLESNKKLSFHNIGGSPDLRMVNYLEKERNFDTISTTHFITNKHLNETDFTSVNTCNSNCRETFFMPNSSHKSVVDRSNFLINEHDSCKKFISELHINIKEPQPIDGDNSFLNINNKEFSRANYTTSRVCNVQSYVGDRDDEYEFNQRNSFSSDNAPSSSDCPVVKKECHLSEKFIYLGGDPQIALVPENPNYELESYHEPVEMFDDLQRDSSIRSDESVVNEMSRSFSSKSVQTSRKLDCILKKTSDKCVDTDFIGVTFKKAIDVDRRDIITNESTICREKTASTSYSNHLSLEYTESINNKKQKFRTNYDYENEGKHFTSNCKQTKNCVRNVVKTRKPLPNLNTNQDTDIGSYSESFNKSNISYSEENEDTKQYRFATDKQTNRRHEVVKSSKSNVNKKQSGKGKNHNRYLDRKETNKSKEAQKGNETNEVKSKENTKITGEQHSYEIQCLLDNLNIHLQNTVNSHKSKINPSKSTINQFNTTSSFWDNPLNPETSRSLFMNKQTTPKILEMNRHKTLNPEIQALFETLEKSNHKPDKVDNSNNTRMRKSPKLDLNARNLKLSNASINDSPTAKKCGDGVGSADNLNEVRFPSNLKFQKLFELSPYDELVKSHLNSADRRIKSVAAKNGCQIFIDGPINLTDPTSTCQAIRSKIAYRCAVAGTSKDRLDKCLNYLKETFPNTCLRLHNRNIATIKS